MHQKFTIPKVSKKDPNKWFVYFRFNGKLKVFKGGLNRIRDLKEREFEANTLAKVLHEELKKGWNPFNQNLIDKNQKLPFIKALDFALEKKKPNLANKSYLGYRSSLKFIKNSIKNINTDHLYIDEVTRYHIKLILEDAAEKNKWSNKSYNKYLGHLKSIISELLEWNFINQNPAHGIKSKKVDEVFANIPPTDLEQIKIKEYLQIKDFNFYRYIVMIYHTGIRPAEILKIKVKNVFLDKRLIYLPSEITKTKKERIVPINPHLFTIFNEMELHQHPADFYLFGAFEFNHKHRASKGLDFIPAPNEVKRDTATKRWEKLIKKDLGVEKNMYSLKHKGADDKILAGIDLDALRELYGHRSKYMTEKYARAVKDLYRKQIIDNSPDF